MLWADPESFSLWWCRNTSAPSQGQLITDGRVFPPPLFSSCPSHSAAAAPAWKTNPVYDFRAPPMKSQRGLFFCNKTIKGFRRNNELMYNKWPLFLGPPPPPFSVICKHPGHCDQNVPWYFYVCHEITVHQNGKKGIRKMRSTLLLNILPWTRPAGP